MPKGNSGWKRELNEKKQVVSQTFVDAAGNPIVTTDGYATVKRSYDEAGNVVSEERFDADGQPCP